MQTQKDSGPVGAGASTVVRHDNAHRAMAAAMLDVDPITKARKNEKQGFNFRGIDDVYNMLHSVFARHGLFVLPSVKEHSVAERSTANGGKQLHHTIRCCFRITHESGTFLDIETYGEAADTGDKGAGKAQQYAYKVALLQAFLIPTDGDNDPDAQAVEWADQRQAAAPRPGNRQAPPQQQGGRPPQRPIERPPQRGAERGRQPAQRPGQAPEAGPAAPGAAPAPAGGETPAQRLGKRLKEQLCSAKTPEELQEVRARVAAELQELRGLSERAHSWVIDLIAKHEQQLTGQPPVSR